MFYWADVQTDKELKPADTFLVFKYLFIHSRAATNRYFITFYSDDY